MTDFWVFGYGSLMWRPEFEPLETVRARLHGYRRSLCISSHIMRGTPERPGLVLGLDRGGSCVGLAFRVDGDKHDKIMADLRARELVTNVYLECLRSVRLVDGRRVPAVCYVVDRHHDQYLGALSVQDAANRVAGATGKFGPNEDYVLNTVDHLRELNIRDGWLEAVARRLQSNAPSVSAR
ncbi:gamma-glutamylcyclotransferase [Notoacmeibacter sp. MSK16QG-6]|uniref:gamma-glutamylcyclotransferase n=1 Tax=Notoacmeibacter sp. MSK16QG-6 TaxID=2957982 RepID=UPI0020A1CAEE|nr:gamma-glutamylcyclotransferase [Notoacmeibacter sp. MSK16QG-6]MCP1199986.1 gamma-glutamylcyclotransferase [Notoacmeibacter sp. MSK16QG-6]